LEDLGLQGNDENNDDNKQNTVDHGAVIKIRGCNPVVKKRRTRKGKVQKEAKLQNFILSLLW
jgi:hypothetical protein